LRPAQAPLTSCRTTGYCIGVNGLEAPNGWIFSQSEGRNGVSHTEYNITISQHVTK